MVAKGQVPFSAGRSLLPGRGNAGQELRAPFRLASAQPSSSGGQAPGSGNGKKMVRQEDLVESVAGVGILIAVGIRGLSVFFHHSKLTFSAMILLNREFRAVFDY